MCKKGGKSLAMLLLVVAAGADMYGNFLDVQVNEASALYSWLQLAGPDHIGVGQGELTPATGLSTYAFYNADPDDDTMWALNPGKFAAIGGDGYAMLAVPAVSGEYIVASIEGMYNILSMEYEPAASSETSDYGTLEINADHTWTIWWNVDGSTAPATNDGEGTWADAGNGRISIKLTGLGNLGQMAIYPSANGNILVMYYRFSHPIYGSFYGMIVGLPQASVASGDFDGTYDVINSDDTAFEQVSITGATVSTGGGPVALTFNSPWTGMTRTDGGDYVIASQDGLIVAVSSNGGASDDYMSLIVIEQ
jgi:hypothetical protein